MNSTKRSWTAVGFGLATLVIVAGCAQTVPGRAVAAQVAQTSPSTTSPSTTSSSAASSTETPTSTSTSTSTTDTGGGTRTNGTRTSTSESSATSTSEREDTNVAPLSKDLLWSYRSFNADWTEVTDEEGIHEYQYKETKCILGLYQPGGYLERSELPPDSQVVAEYVDYVGKKFTDPTTVTIDTTGREFDTDLNGTPDADVPATILLAGEHVTYASDGGEAQIYGYRNADYALVVAMVCKGGEFPTYLAEFSTKLDDLAVGLYY